MDSAGNGSSSRISATEAPVAVRVEPPPWRTPFVGLLNCRTIVSSSSSKRSPMRAISMSFR